MAAAAEQPLESASELFSSTVSASDGTSREVGFWEEAD
jgi:hypothetical protein